MKRLMIGSALVLLMSQATQAYTNEKILDVFKKEISDQPKLCKILGSLPAEDLRRLHTFLNPFDTAPQTPVEKDIEKIYNDPKNSEFHGCLEELMDKSQVQTSPFA